MNIDLRRLYSLKSLVINEEIIFAEDYYKHLDIISISPIIVTGQILINSANEIELKCNLKGNFTMPCAISLEAVTKALDIDIDEIITENQANNKLTLALLDVLWENIVLEVPISIVKEGITTESLKGEGWQVESES